MPRTRVRRSEVLGLAVVLPGLAATGFAADRPSSAVPPEPAPAPAASDDEVGAQPAGGRATEAAQADELKLRYATARVRLAELDLERALAANQAVAGAVGDRELDRLRNHVGLMHRQLQLVRDQPRTAARQATLAAAHAACAAARGDLAAALKANHRVPGTVSDLNVKRLRAKLDLAEIRVALCQNPAYELSLLDEMQWSIDQLTDQLIDLRHQVETGNAGDFGQPD